MFYSETLLRTIAWDGGLSDSSEVLLQRGSGGARCIEVFAGGKRLLLITNNGHLKSVIFSAFLCMGRCRNLGLLKLFLWYACWLSRTSILVYFPSWILSGAPWGGLLSGSWLHGCNILCLLKWQVTFFVLPPFSHKFNQCLGGSSRLILSHSARKAHF